MIKKLTLILLSSIFMSGLATRPTLQDVREAIPTLKDVRNTVTVRNACKVAGGAAGFFVGAKIGYYIHFYMLDCPNYLLRIPLPYLGSFAFKKLGPFVYESFDLTTTIPTRKLRILPTVAAFTGATLGARLSGATYDKAAKKLADRRASNNNQEPVN